MVAMISLERSTMGRRKSLPLLLEVVLEDLDWSLADKTGSSIQM
jgi:hypothetical protein